MPLAPLLSVCLEFIAAVYVLLVGLLGPSSYGLVTGLSPVAVLSGVHKMNASWRGLCMVWYFYAKLLLKLISFG